MKVGGASKQHAGSNTGKLVQGVGTRRQAVVAGSSCCTAAVCVLLLLRWLPLVQRAGAALAQQQVPHPRLLRSLVANGALEAAAGKLPHNRLVCSARGGGGSRGGLVWQACMVRRAAVRCALCRKPHAAWAGAPSDAAAQERQA